MARTSTSTAIIPGKVLHAGAVATPNAVIRKPSDVIPSTFASSDAVCSRGTSIIVGKEFRSRRFSFMVVSAAAPKGLCLHDTPVDRQPILERWPRKNPETDRLLHPGHRR